MFTSAVVATLVGQEAITEVSKSVFQSIAGIFYHTNPIVNEILENLNIYNDLDLIKTLINEINKQTINDKSLIIKEYEIKDEDSLTIIYEKEQKLLEKSDKRSEPFISETLQKCLLQLKEQVEKINHEIGELDKQVQYHNTLWFKSFRTPKYMANINRITHLKKILKSRYTDLVQLMNIYLRMDYKLFQKMN